MRYEEIFLRIPKINSYPRFPLRTPPNWEASLFLRGDPDDDNAWPQFPFLKYLLSKQSLLLAKQARGVEDVHPSKRPRRESGVSGALSAARKPRMSFDRRLSTGDQQDHFGDVYVAHPPLVDMELTPTRFSDFSHPERDFVESLWFHVADKLSDALEGASRFTTGGVSLAAPSEHLFGPTGAAGDPSAGGRFGLSSSSAATSTGGPSSSSRSEDQKCGAVIAALRAVTVAVFRHLASQNMPYIRKDNASQWAGTIREWLSCFAREQRYGQQSQSSSQQQEQGPAISDFALRKRQWVERQRFFERPSRASDIGLLELFTDLGLHCGWRDCRNRCRSLGLDAISSKTSSSHLTGGPGSTGVGATSVLSSTSTSSSMYLSNMYNGSAGAGGPPPLYSDRAQSSTTVRAHELQYHQLRSQFHLSSLADHFVRSGAPSEALHRLVKKAAAFYERMENQERTIPVFQIPLTRVAAAKLVQASVSGLTPGFVRAAGKRTTKFVRMALRDRGSGGPQTSLAPGGFQGAGRGAARSGGFHIRDGLGLGVDPLRGDDPVNDPLRGDGVVSRGGGVEEVFEVTKISVRQFAAEEAGDAGSEARTSM